jgi:hypothetical protein
MATVTVQPGALIVMDPSDKKVIIFDFDTLNLANGVELANTASAYGITISAVKTADPTELLTFDNAALVTGNRKVTARFIATTANRGDKYRVSVKATTNESPVQEKEYSIFIKIEDR